jgi:F-type H+-transporting ATPase subunit delta
MKLSSRQYAEALLDVTHGASESDTRAVIKRLRELLRRNRAEKLWPAIIASYTRIQRERSGHILVRMETAHDHPEAQIRAALSERLGAEVDLELSARAELIGGAVITVGDTRIDGSVRTQLDLLRRTLSTPEAQSIHHIATV